MFVKLYSRITESSLMEESVGVRYTFLMLLAIADPTGLVVGTDIAIARRLNVPLDDFVNSVKTLGEPDMNSNSKEEEGRRVIPSDSERGYQLVNFLKYRNLKDEDEKRKYMREYMQKRRASKGGVKQCNPMLNVLAKVTQAEAEAEATPKAVHTHLPEGTVIVNGELQGVCDSFLKMFGRPEGSRLTYAEQSTIADLARSDQFTVELEVIQDFRARLPAEDRRYFPQSLSRLLGAWQETLDRARNYQEPVTKPKDQGWNRDLEYLKSI